MQCALYDAGRCRSCQWITQPIPEQLSAKTADLKNLLADFPATVMSRLTTRCAYDPRAMQAGAQSQYMGCGGKL